MSETHAVFFDVGGTLVEVSPSIGHVYSEAIALRGGAADPRQVQKAFDLAWVTLSKDVPSGADRYRLFPGGEEEWWERVSCFAFEQCDVAEEYRPSVHELRSVFSRAEAWKIYPEAREVLAQLGRESIRLAVISNWDSRLPALMKTLELDSHFEFMVYSAEIGCEKPDPAIFSRAVEEMGVDPSRAVHIGDRLEEDYTGARSAGLKALLLNRSPGNPGLQSEVEERWGQTGDLVVDLNEALRRILD